VRIRTRTVAAAMAAAILVASLGAAAAERKDAGAPDAGARSAAQPPPKPPFEDEIVAFEAADRKFPDRGRPTIVFIGSSSIRMWQSLATDFPQHRVLNRGFGGSELADSVRYADRILAAHQPPLIVMYAGTNDINNGKSPATVAADFRAFTAKVWERLPNTQIAYISISTNPSRYSQVALVREANRLIAAACAADPRLRFVDVFSLVLGPDGLPRRELFISDGLHMNASGYRLWVPPIRDLLDAVVPAPRERDVDARKGDAK
jgi:lysophospholipase L1-like esterase